MGVVFVPQVTTNDELLIFAFNMPTDCFPEIGDSETWCFLLVSLKHAFLHITFPFVTS